MFLDPDVLTDLALTDPQSLTNGDIGVPFGHQIPHNLSSHLRSQVPSVRVQGPSNLPAMVIIPDRHGYGLVGHTDGVCDTRPLVAVKYPPVLVDEHRHE